jgi:hypothetical protein
MYLLHGIFIRSLLVWGLYRFTSPPEENVASQEEEGTVDVTRFTLLLSLIWRVTHYASVWVGFFGVLFFSSVIWKNTVDEMSVQVAKRLQEAMTGKKPLIDRNFNNKWVTVDEFDESVMKELV